MNLKATRWVLAAVAALAMAACGGSGDGGGSGGSGGSGAGGGSGGNGSGGSAGECSEFLDEAKAPVTLRFRNEGAETLFLGTKGCGTSELFTLRDAGGQELSWYAGDCPSTCELSQEGDVACTGLCPVPWSIKIEPGGYHDLAWDGRIRVQREMPDACYGGFALDSCMQQAQAPAGSYEITSSLFMQAQCTSGAMPCDCQVSAEGSCAMPESAVDGTALEATATLSLPAPDVVELVFQ